MVASVSVSSMVVTYMSLMNKTYIYRSREILDMKLIWKPYKFAVVTVFGVAFYYHFTKKMIYEAGLYQLAVIYKDEIKDNN